MWETIRKGIVAKVKAAGAVKSKLFDLGLAAKKYGGRGSFLGNVADSVVFKAVKENTGGKLKYAMSGGAPISKETQEFLSLALVMIIQGCEFIVGVLESLYLSLTGSSFLPADGMTESTAYVGTESVLHAINLNS